MVQNFPGPYELRLLYAETSFSPDHEHVARYNVDLTTTPTPGTDFSAINAKTRGGVATPSLDSVVEDWLTLIAAIFKTTAAFTAVELWQYAAQSFDATFVSAYTPTKNDGDSTSAVIQAGQAIYTWRSLEGGILKLNFMESIHVSGPTVNYPTGSTPVNNIFDFVASTDNWILARDTSYPFVPLHFLPGISEALFKKYHR